MIPHLGEWIAVVFGLVAVFRWIMDWMKDDKKSSSADVDALWGKVNELRGELMHLQAEFAGHKGMVDNERTWLKEALARLERKVDNVQAQMRHVATGSNDRVFKGGTDD